MSPGLCQYRFEGVPCPQQYANGILHHAVMYWFWKGSWCLQKNQVRDWFVLLQEIDTQSDQPSLLRGQTGSETEAHFVQVIQQADSDLTGMISRQVRHVLYCSPAYKAAHLPSYHIQEVTEQSLLCYPMIILFETDSDQRCMHSSTAVGCFARHHSQSVYCS